MSGADRSREPRLAQAARRREQRAARAHTEGEPTLAQQVGRVGVMGWLVVVPALLLGWIGRWLDTALGTGITFAGALLMAGIALGCWSGWKWMHRR